MYILTRRNRVIDYCEAGYTYVGNIVVCESKGTKFEDATIVYTEKSIPADIEGTPYDYINGEFIRVIPLSVSEGGTGATTAEEARNNLGIPDLEWHTLGSVSYEYVSESPEYINDERETITMPLDEELLRDFQHFRFVIKKGSRLYIKRHIYEKDRVAPGQFLISIDNTGTDEYIYYGIHMSPADSGNEKELFFDEDFCMNINPRYKSIYIHGSNDEDGDGVSWCDYILANNLKDIKIEKHGGVYIGTVLAIGIQWDCRFTIELQGKR